MPFTRESLGERLPAGGFSGYLGQFLTGGRPEGVSYTYGSRLRDFGGAIDQVAAIVAALWSPVQDIGSPSPPCLNLVQARLRASPGDGAPRLFLTAYFRSHDIFRAWASNAYGLCALQGLIAEGLGDLAILSHSAHIYAHNWERTGELIAHYYRTADPRPTRDARSSFVVALEPCEILVHRHVIFMASQCSKCRARPPPTTAGPRSSTAGRRGQNRPLDRRLYHITAEIRFGHTPERLCYTNPKDSWPPPTKPSGAALLNCRQTRPTLAAPCLPCLSSDSDGRAWDRQARARWSNSMTNDNLLTPSQDEEHNPPPSPSPDDRTRLYLALVVAALVTTLALAAVVQPTASAVLDKVLPLLTLVLGYFFGQEVRRARS
jgi:hypothetical protein